MKGQITIPILLSVGALLGMVAAPAIWISGKVSAVEGVNAVQNIRIDMLEKVLEDLRNDNKMLVKKVDVLLLNRGINPANVDKIIDATNF